MRNDKLIPGTILVIIGVLFLLDNFGTIDFDWFSLFRLWPLLLVMAGVNLIFANNKSAMASGLKIFVLVAGVAVLIVNGLIHRNESRDWDIFSARDDNNVFVDDIHLGDKNTAHFEEAYKPEIQQAVLNINGGITNYMLKDTTSKLFEANTRAANGNYNLTPSIDSLTETLDFGQDGGGDRRHGFSIQFWDKSSNKAFIKLNAKPIWEINVGAGVAKTYFDLTAFKVSALNIKGGVSKFKVKMGQPLAETNIDVETGVSRLTIEIPKNAACHIISNKAKLSSKRFDDFEKVDNNEYQTSGFDNATNKIYIRLSGGLSNFRVNKY